MRNPVLLDTPTRDEHDNIIGSPFTPELVAATGKVSAAGVLSRQQIMIANKLTEEEFQKIEQQIMGMRLDDILMSFPEGPRYDILGYRWAFCR